MAEIAFLGILAFLIVKVMLWLKKNRFPIFVGNKTFKEIARDFRKENIDKEIIFSERAKSRIVIAELIPYRKTRYIEELREENKKNGYRFLTATELACLGLRYKNNKKLSNCFVFTTHPTSNIKMVYMHNKIILIEDRHSPLLGIDDIENIYYNMNIPSGYRFYTGVVKIKKGLWMRFLMFLCRIIFLAETILKRKILT